MGMFVVQGGDESACEVGMKVRARGGCGGGGERKSGENGRGGRYETARGAAVRCVGKAQSDGRGEECCGGRVASV